MEVHDVVVDGELPRKERTLIMMTRMMALEKSEKDGDYDGYYDMEQIRKMLLFGKVAG